MWPRKFGHFNDFKPFAYRTYPLHFQVALRELHTTIHERDRLRAALDEALTSCAGAVVAQQVAEASQGELQKQLAEVRQQLVTIHDSRSHR